MIEKSGGNSQKLKDACQWILCKGEAGIKIFRSRSSGGFPWVNPYNYVMCEQHYLNRKVVSVIKQSSLILHTDSVKQVLAFTVGKLNFC